MMKTKLVGTFARKQILRKPIKKLKYSVYITKALRKSSGPL